jgi:Raf kinase inhibitor-like YbhB/YbcL family protein
MKRSLATLAFSLLAALSLALRASAAELDLTSPAFAEGATLPDRFASVACGGRALSPPLAWSAGPAGTTSYALVMYDPDGQLGLGVVHWVAYNIPAQTTSLGEGLPAGTPAFSAGKNSRGTLVYLGPCPPAGDRPHHYLISVFATDLPPAALADGLDRDALYVALKGHVLAHSSLVVRFGR